MHPAHHTARVRGCGSTRAHGHSLSPLAAGELWWEPSGTFWGNYAPPVFQILWFESSTNRSKADIERADGRRRHVFAAAAARGGAGGL